VHHVPALDIWPVNIDPGQFDVALLNLAFNARDAMPEGGVLTISTSNLTIGSQAASRRENAPPGDYVRVEVGDTGTGMSEDTQRRAVEPFFTTKPPGKGSGLGLSMVHGFVLQSGGQVRIRSAPGKGTQICLLFPRASRLAASAKPNKPEAAQPVIPAQAGTTVLIVEDDPLVREHAARSLNELGYSVTLASTAEEALDLLDRHPAMQLLFTDIVLGSGLSGIELACEARRRHPDLKVLYTSGYVPGKDGLRSALAPEAILLAKPYERSELIRCLARALGGMPG